MTAYAGNYTKSVADIPDISLDFAQVLGSDTILSATWSVSPSGLTAGSIINTSTTTSARLTGGAANTEYVITVTVSTASGAKYQQPLLILVDGLLTSQQLADLQGDLGIGNDQAVFTDGDLNRLYVRAGNDHDKTIVLALRQMLADASKLHDYSAGSTSESLSQVRANLEKLLTRWENIAGMGSGGRLRSGKIALGIDEPYPS
ncbi:MAG: hypothetical protein LC130_23230 [Bryobacterales bacterium]|nr:hypothetical protein [Bryobacterales bacterium]